MPIYEYLCAKCNRVYRFLMPTMVDVAPPACPRCASPTVKQISRFSFVRGGKDPLAAIPESDAGDATTDEPRAAQGPSVDEELYVVRGGRVESSG
jgi:putative FmdB family regulatory protein